MPPATVILPTSAPAAAFDPVLALLAACALHAGFQLTVRLVAYPALVATAPEHWEQRHTAHSRSIVPVVGAVYAALVASGAWVLWATARAGLQPGAWGWATLVLAAIAPGVTAVGAAPLHGRLGREGPDPRLLRRLLVLDTVRTLAAIAALAAAWMAVHTATTTFAG